MKNEVYTIYHLSLNSTDFPAFETLITKIVNETSKEPDTLTYEYVVNEDRTAVHIIERYRPDGIVPHSDTTFAPFAEEFLSLVRIEKLYVYGETTPEIRTRLDRFDALYFSSFAGFSR
jgi:quinol monooxygenase YgiN